MVPVTCGPKIWCGIHLWTGRNPCLDRSHLKTAAKTRRGTFSSSTANSLQRGDQHCKSPYWQQCSEYRSMNNDELLLFFGCRSRFLRNKDRDDNKDNYPALHWPEIYLLHGGYKAFFQLFPFQDGCTPLGYLPMNQQGHEEDLRRCRAKTKSCNGDGKSGRPLTKSTSRRLEMQKL